MTDKDLLKQKTDHAVEALNTLDIDCWLTYCRESDMMSEPSLPFVLGYDVVWPTIVLISSDGRKSVIVGENDASGAEELGVHEVIAYDEALEEPFRELIAEIDPDNIGINYSEDHQTADGLTYGLKRRLDRHLDGTPYAGRLTSAEEIVKRVRGRKSRIERDRIRRAGETTEAILDEMAAAWEPEWTEAETAAFMQDRIAERDLDPAWSPEHCPAVDAGGAAEVGHASPGARTLPPGEVLHIDFGVKIKGYAADLQRLYYYPKSDNPPPAELQAAFRDIRAAIEAGFDALEPGVEGYEVDRAARTELADRGWPEPNHGVGHEVGREAHDGGTLLGPRWEPYGDAVYDEVYAGQIYTIELGVKTDYGYLGQEDMIEVTEQGAEYLIAPQSGFRTLAG